MDGASFFCFESMDNLHGHVGRSSMSPRPANPRSQSSIINAENVAELANAFCFAFLFSIEFFEFNFPRLFFRPTHDLGE